MEKNRKLKRNAETLQGSTKGRNQIACEREGNRQLFAFALPTMASSNLVPSILSYSFHGCRVGEDPGKEVGLRRVFFSTIRKANRNRQHHWDKTYDCKVL